MSTESQHQPGSGHTVALRAERRWAIFAGALIVLMLAVIVYSGLHWAMMPPSRVETIDPSRLQLSGEFVEDNLGSAVEPDGSVVVRFIAQQYSFTPQCLLVPADTPITIRTTSADVVHGLLVTGTNINTMVVPGYVATLNTRFDAPADHTMPCHEFCGFGHQAMWAHVKVIDKAAFLEQARQSRRLSCVSR
ncbi:cupredoxin domain-containing protein [Paraburkholderia kirstenboschensis]|uniref:Cytochrome C oxidase subunit II n=1 Tax=Paraburkholderia kirstenboschensis TaxID=1245436 RepID=A0ABZ0EP43_9BURK|nr:cytochrome C oxidase subunit II [Paraburkholderia kirstenboschensis]WOD18366.1 cytochrome C oxidase subunit II [Paraburkholderia kirstenboschensis]CAD6530864.1 Cytochrome c oxidase subunit 2 [Paraburkholderia kirstenboschensis]